MRSITRFWMQDAQANLTSQDFACGLAANAWCAEIEASGALRSCTREVLRVPSTTIVRGDRVLTSAGQTGTVIAMDKRLGFNVELDAEFVQNPCNIPGIGCRWFKAEKVARVK
jgi:hypothetical protein